MSSIIPNKVRVSDFYQYAIHLIFAIIVASSFDQAFHILIPLDKVFADISSLALAASLLFSYIVIITGWVGYARSMSIQPHKDNHKDSFRFLIDLIILFEYFYLLQLTTTEKFISEFHIVLPIIFITYFIWDAVKYFEYSGKMVRISIKSRMRKTAMCTVPCMVPAFGYHLTLTTDVFLQFVDRHYTLLLYAALMLAVVALYRLWKWNVRWRKQPTKMQSNNRNKTDHVDR